MWGLWILNSSAQLETFERLQPGGRSVSCPDYTELRQGPVEKIERVARVRLIDGTIHTAEVHWYEAHGVGRRELKIKFPLLD
jgi:hypothetical protein